MLSVCALASETRKIKVESKVEWNKIDIFGACKCWIMCHLSKYFRLLVFGISDEEDWDGVTVTAVTTPNDIVCKCFY